MTQVYGPFISRAQAKAQGLRQYYVGPCKHGHLSPKGVANHGCVTCSRLRAADIRLLRGVKPREVIQEERLEKAGGSAVYGPFISYEQAVEKGYKTFYTGSVCSRFHVGERYTSGRECVQCVAEKQKESRDKDPASKLIKNLRTRLHHCLTSEYEYVSISSLIGCSKDHLVQWLESQFKQGMSWENYGIRGWHIDHIRPCASFDNPLDPQLWHYSNLQPLWGEENIRKSDKWSPDPDRAATSLIAA